MRGQKIYGRMIEALICCDIAALRKIDDEGFALYV